MRVNDRELATILAALRLWQGHLTNTLGLPAALIDIAQDAGPMLEVGEIDELCERVNYEPERRYIAVRLDAGHDANGNNRRGWLVYADTEGQELLGWTADAGGLDYLRRAIIAAERCPGRKPTALEIDRVSRDDSRAFQDADRVRVLCELSVPYREVREARTYGPVKLPG